MFAFGNDPAKVGAASTVASQFACGNDKAATTGASTGASTGAPQFAFGNDKGTHTGATTGAPQFAFVNDKMKLPSQPKILHHQPQVSLALPLFFLDFIGHVKRSF